MFNSKSPFEVTPKELIPENIDIVFVSDLFSVDYVGGAELTTDSLIESSPLRVFRIRSRSLTIEHLQAGYQKFWIFGNFGDMNPELIPSIVANLKYSILEYDYKYCKYRSPQKHETIEGTPCDCHNQMNGKMVSAFMHGAKSLWWMSEKQQNSYHKLFPFLTSTNNTVLSSVFDDNFFSTVKLLNEKNANVERKKWLIVGSASWIKGVDDAEAWCKENNLEYEVLWNVPYQDLLEKFSLAKGLVFLPKGADTCPRIVIEAKLLGCELHINDNVQHKDELWFASSDRLDTESYLYLARQRFWAGIKHDMTYKPKISGYTTTYNCISQDYPFEESIRSMLGFCNQVIVVDGGSTDGTWEFLETLSKSNEKLIVKKNERNWSDQRFAVFDGQQKAEARSLCSGDFCWQQDSDEIVHENDYEKIQTLTREFPNNICLISLPVIEYWGGPDKVRMDIYPWKWRLSRNLPFITHGIPAHLRKYDEQDRMFAAPGTDGCDYIHNVTGQIIPNATFYTQDVDNLRKQGMTDFLSRKQYSDWFASMTENLPSIHHYSWFDINRKTRTYRDYWSKHWQSLYNITQDDTPENNMFFQRPWSEVSEEDIDKMSIDLAEKMGGWIFHSPVDFSHPTPHLPPMGTHPSLIENWIKRHQK